MNNTATAPMGDKKSMFDLPGGKVGLVVLAILIAGGCIVLYRILPYLITLAENTLYLLFMLAIIGVVLYVAFDKRARQLISVGYFMLMRWLTGLVVELDPIAIVERRIADMRKKILQISKCMGDLLGFVRSAEKDILKDKKELEDAIEAGKWNRSQGKNDEAVVHERQSIRLRDAVETQLKNLDDSKKWYETLSKIEKMAQLTVQDTENEVNQKKKAFERIRKQHKAFKSVMSIVNGDPDELALFNRAMDFMADDMDRKLGEMEHVILSTGGLLSEFETANGVNSQKATALFEAYEKGGLESLFSSFSTTTSGEDSGKLGDVFAGTTQGKSSTFKYFGN